MHINNKFLKAHRIDFEIRIDICVYKTKRQALGLINANLYDPGIQRKLSIELQFKCIIIKTILISFGIFALQLFFYFFFFN